MRLKIALLEDNKEILKDLKESIGGFTNFEVVCYATNSADFMEKVRSVMPEAIMVDIDLGGDSMNGIEVAFKLKLPVLFISGNNASYLKDIELLKREYDIVVDHLSKPYTPATLEKAANRFAKDVELQRRSKSIVIDFKETKKNRIQLDTIVYLSAAHQNIKLPSNNKKIYFTDRKPQDLIDFSFSKMVEKGFDDEMFLRISKNTVVNRNRIVNFEKPSTLKVLLFGDNGVTEQHELKIGDDYISLVRSRL